MNEIVVEGLDIPVVQKITGIKLRNAHQVERQTDGIKSNVNVILMSGETQLGNRKIRRAVQDNTFMSWEELNLASQATLQKDFLDLTVTESQQVQGQVFATKMITAINEADAGVDVDNVTELVTAIVTALA